ncbi:MAG: DinB family protein [Planctomycetes bacterium]|nr:DinB family protein [Planctomycetota bacterium]
MTAGKPGPVNTNRYLSAISKKDPIASMAGAPDRIAKLLRGLDEKTMAKRPAPGKWSIKEVIAHLADGEFMVGSRIRMVAAMEKPVMIGYDQDAFVERLHVDQRTTGELFIAFAAVRAANVALFELLPKSSYTRVGLHNERGEESIGAMLDIYSGHDLVHEEQIKRTREQLAPKSAAKSAKTPANPKR